MISNFSALSEVRSASRARAIESFEFFACHVLGLRIPTQTCTQIERRGTQGLEALSPAVRTSYVAAYDLWTSLVQGQVVYAPAPTETFAWLFAEEMGRAA